MPSVVSTWEHIHPLSAVSAMKTGMAASLAWYPWYPACPVGRRKGLCPQVYI